MSHPRASHFDRNLILALVLLSGLVDLPRQLQFGPVSGLGLLTIAQCGVVWLAWLAWPASPADRGPLFPLILFNLFATGSLLWAPDPLAGVQNLAVFLSFLGIVLLSAREAHADDSLGADMGKVVRAASLLATGLFASTLVPGAGPVAAVTERAFALFALIAVAYHLALWRYGVRTALPVAAAVTAVVFLSMSRMAFVVAVLLFPLAVLLRGGRREIFKALAMSVVAGGALAAAIFLYAPMYERFFGFDVSFSIGGVPINASGRARLWEDLMASFRRHVIFGQGVGSTDRFIVDRDLGHPHNDYLRLAHDYGLLGLALWSTGAAWVMTELFRNVRRRAPAAGPAAAIHLAALLGLVGVCTSMATDNSLVYNFVMAPLGALIGASLGRAARESPPPLFAPAAAGTRPAPQPRRRGPTVDTSWPGGLRSPRPKGGTR